MSISDIKRAKKLRDHGDKIGREGLSESVTDAVAKYNDSITYKQAMVLCGRLKAIAQAAKCDAYWSEQVDKGFRLQMREFGLL